MTPGRARDERTERQWRRWIEPWRASGLSGRAFCARRGRSGAAYDPPNTPSGHFDHLPSLLEPHAVGHPPNGGYMPPAPGRQTQNRRNQRKAAVESVVTICKTSFTRLPHQTVGECVGQSPPGRQLEAAQPAGGHVSNVAVASDGEQALVAGEYGSIMLPELEHSREPHRFHGHTAEVDSVAFPLDGRRAISGSSGRTVRLWRWRRFLPAGKNWQHGPPESSSKQDEGRRK